MRSFASYSGLGNMALERCAAVLPPGHSIVLPAQLVLPAHAGDADYDVALRWMAG